MQLPSTTTDSGLRPISWDPSKYYARTRVLGDRAFYAVLFQDGKNQKQALHYEVDLRSGNVQKRKIPQEEMATLAGPFPDGKGRDYVGTHTMSQEDRVKFGLD